MLVKSPIVGARSLLAVLALALMAAVVLASCGGGGTASAGGAQQVDVKLSEFKFEPASVAVKANQPVKLTVQNTGAVRHDLTVKGLDQPVKVVAEPGKTASVDFTPTKAGTYEMVCEEPGHLEAGMKGQLVVQ